MSSDEKKREELRWFPADNISDCDAEPGLEQVKLTDQRQDLVSYNLSITILSLFNAEHDHGRYVHYYVTTLDFTHIHEHGLEQTRKGPYCLDDVIPRIPAEQ